MKKNTVVIVAGPTAVGKTAFAVELARQLGTSVISADSRQCYREMKVGVARPTEEELASVKHYFVASHSVTDDLNAGSFEQYALRAADEIFTSAPFVVMTGGTGLYIKAFCEGIDPMPEIPGGTREEIAAEYDRKGLIWLQKELSEKDPSFWAVAERQNPQRLMRALEVLRATGHSIMAYRTAKKAERPFNIVKIGLELERGLLNERIDRRVDQMVRDGLEQEARELLPYRSYNALQTVGYREWFDHFDGKASREETIQAIKTNTRHYAKRQMTWFRKDEGFRWIGPGLDSVPALAASL